MTALWQAALVAALAPHLVVLLREVHVLLVREGALLHVVVLGLPVVLARRRPRRLRPSIVASAWLPARHERKKRPAGWTQRTLRLQSLLALGLLLGTSC